MIWILLYLIIGVLFNHKIAKTVEGSSSDKMILLLVNLIVILLWRLVICLVLYTAVHLDSKQAAKPLEENRKEEEKE